MASAQWKGMTSRLCLRNHLVVRRHCLFLLSYILSHRFLRYQRNDAFLPGSGSELDGFVAP